MKTVWPRVEGCQEEGYLEYPVPLWPDPRKEDNELMDWVWLCTLNYQQVDVMQCEWIRKETIKKCRLLRDIALLWATVPTTFNLLEGSE